MDYAVAPSAFLHPAALTSPFTSHKSRPRCASEEQSLAKEMQSKIYILSTSGITLAFDSRYLLLCYVPLRNVPDARFSVPAAQSSSL